MRTAPLRWRFTVGFIVLQLFAVAVSLGLVLYSISSLSREEALPSVWLSNEVAISLGRETGARSRSSRHLPSKT